jgi:hypothetical protein
MLTSAVLINNYFERLFSNLNLRKHILNHQIFVCERVHKYSKYAVMY